MFRTSTIQFSQSSSVLLAPEVRLLGDHFSPAADVYSYGCLMKHIAASEDELKKLRFDHLPSFIVADTSYFYIQVWHVSNGHHKRL